MTPPDPWTPAAVKRLGTISDTVIANELGLTRQAVAAKRTALGIAAAGARPGPKPRGEEGEGLRIRLTAEERAVLERAAGEEPLSQWARRTLIAAAKRAKKRGAE
jgi:hypothetical protein